MRAFLADRRGQRVRFWRNVSDEVVGNVQTRQRAIQCCMTSPLRDDTVQGFAEDLEVRESARSRHCVSWTNCTAMLESDPPSDELRQRGSQEPEGGTDPGSPVPSPSLLRHPFSLAQVLPWLIFAGMLLLVAMYFISAEQGAASLFSGTGVHGVGPTTSATCSASPATEPGAVPPRLPGWGSARRPVRGLVAFGVAYVIGEPSVNAAIAIEESAGSGHDQVEEPASSEVFPWHQSAAYSSPRWAC